MRLLFVVHQFLPEFASGTERVTLGLALAARRAGHRADVLTCVMGEGGAWGGRTADGWREVAVQGLSVTGIPAALLPDEFGFRPAANRAVIPAVDRLLEQGAYDLVHATHAMRMIDVLERVLAAGLPLLLTLTDFFLLCHRINLVRLDGGACGGPDGARACRAHCATHGVDGPALDRRQARTGALVRGAAARVAGSAFVAEAFRREHPDSPVRVVPHGIAAPSAPRRRAGASAGVVFGYVGTVSAAKGVDTLIAAFQAVPDAGARLDLVGPLAGTPGFTAALSQAAAADPRIRVRGALAPEEVPDAMAEFDLLCLPTRLPETFSLALHEGFAAGLPCFVSDLGHPATVVRDAGCGRVLPAGDTAAWTAAMQAVANQPEQLAAWRGALPLPWRVEEEAFLYSQLYKACIA